MRHAFSALLIGAALTTFAAPLRADGTPHLEFVRKLRERNAPDLAAEYLLRIRPTAPPDVAAVLPLELGLSRIQAADAESDRGRKLTVLKQAQADLEEFVAKNPQSERLSDARLNLVRVIVYQGKAQLGKALVESGATKRAEMLAARQLLQEGGKQLAVFAAGFDAQIEKLDDKKPDEKKAKEALEAVRNQALFDSGLNLIDQAQTFSEEDGIDAAEKRAGVVKEAEEVFRKLGREPKDALGWQAKAWVGRCLYEKAEFTQALTVFAQVLNERPTRTNEAGQRLARYFRLVALVERPDPDKEAPLSIAQRWYADYRAFHNTPEGYGVRYQLVNLYYKEAKEAKQPADRARHFNEAKRLARELEQTENEFSDRARQLKLQIVSEQGGLTGDVARLTNFDDCHVRAQYEAYMLGEDAKKIESPQKFADQRKQRLQTILAALNKAEQLAKAPAARVPPTDRYNARLMLSYFAVAAGDLEQAARVGEELAYHEPRLSQSATGAVYALQAFGQALADPEKSGLTPDKEKDYQARMRKLIDHVASNWPNDPAMDFAVHQLGEMAVKARNVPEAVMLLARVRPGYSLAVSAKYLLALCAFQAHKENLKPAAEDADKRPFQARALEALETMPEAPPGADPSLVQTYFLGKIRLAHEYFLARQFDKTEALVGALKQKLPRQALPDDAKKEIRDGLDALGLFVKYGRAEADYAKGDYAKVRAAIDPVVEQAKAGGLAELKKNPQLRWALLGLGLRASMQEGKVDRAQEVLKVLQTMSADNQLEGGADATLQQLVLLLREQMQELKKKGNKDQLKKTIDSYSAFLDELAKQQKAPTPEFVRLMAQSYSSLDRHAKAAELLKSVPPPKPGPNGEKPGPKQVQTYQAAQLLYARELRLDKKLDEAGKLLVEFKREPDGWGRNNIEVLKEYVLWLQDKGLHGRASQESVALVNQLVKKLDVPGMKEHYYECYYLMVYSRLKYGQAQADTSKGQQAIRTAAQDLRNLTKNAPDLGGEDSTRRFDELLASEPEFKKEYEQIK